MAPELKPGLASRKKKADKRGELVEVDKKALDKAIYLETIDMWGSKWHRFEDPRGWIWTQEER